MDIKQLEEMIKLLKEHGINEFWSPECSFKFSNKPPVLANIPELTDEQKKKQEDETLFWSA